MKRRNLFTFAGLLGALGLAKAQRSLGPTGPFGFDHAGLLTTPAKGTEFYADGKCVGVANGDGTFSSCKPKNGQCPQCGTMAPAWRNPPICMGMPDGLRGEYKPVPCGPNEKVVRCAWCSNAFWQDAE